ncbi:hypothetical protein RJ639_042511 [Escallonia herrerae]|uniref:RING-CH-type domain-containing protein n=1 Tax=Escallonia herrerae TaxID=1293975 RepID=A0AA89B5S8_9ASTE|nr:hypothetical protein RJ639_042511 [Escallonia herrerae]
MNGEVQLEPAGDRNPSDSDPLLESHQLTDSPAPAGTSEIKSDDIEAGSVACCRICLECDGDEDEDLISPCMCKGTQQFVHRSCLDHWRSVKEGFAFSHCTTCKAQFHLRVADSEDNYCRKIKFRLFVARDVVLVFLAVQTEIPTRIEAVPETEPKGRMCECILVPIYWFKMLAMEMHWSFTFGVVMVYGVSQGLGGALSPVGTEYYMKDVQKVIGVMGGFAYLMDKDGSFRNSFNDSWDRILSRHPIPFYYCIGVLGFFVLLGFFGLILHCSSFNGNDPRMAGCQNCCYGWGILDCFPASMEACFALVIVFVVIFAILGIAYGFLAATMAIQRIWQRHYHILTKRELTQEYIVEDLRGCYTPPKLDLEHEERLKMLKLL